MYEGCVLNNSYYTTARGVKWLIYWNQQQNQFPDRRMLSNILQLRTTSKIGLKEWHTVCAFHYVILWYNMIIPHLGCYCVLIYYSELIITSAFGLGDYLAPRSILEHNSTLVVEYSYIVLILVIVESWPWCHK